MRPSASSSAAKKKACLWSLSGSPASFLPVTEGQCRDNSSLPGSPLGMQDVAAFPHQLAAECLGYGQRLGDERQGTPADADVESKAGDGEDLRFWCRLPARCWRRGKTVGAACIGLPSRPGWVAPFFQMHIGSLREQIPQRIGTGNSLVSKIPRLEPLGVSGQDADRFGMAVGVAHHAVDAGRVEVAKQPGAGPRFGPPKIVEQIQNQGKRCVPSGDRVPSGQ